jgi:drug/metabolite transporter (DMT)-like permease
MFACRYLRWWNPVPSPGTRRATAALQALLVCFVWSTSFIITKYLYGQGIGPVTLTGLRFALAGLVLLPVWVRRRRTVHTGKPADSKVAARLLILLGLAGYAINPLGYNIGLTVLDASWVAVLLGVNNSLQVLIWSALLLRERPTRLQLGAIAVAIVAVVGFQTPNARRQTLARITGYWHRHRP